VRNFQYYHWEGCMCSETKEIHGKPWSSWQAAGPSECNWLLASSPALNSRTLTVVPTLCYCIFLFCFLFPFFFFFSPFFHNKLFCFTIICMCILFG
jgi:hypothetical protein